MGCCLPSVYGLQQETEPTQEGRADALHYDIEVELQPESRRFTARVTIEFQALDVVEDLIFDLNGNCFVTQVFDGEGREVEHIQNDFETYKVKVRMRDPIEPGNPFRLRFEYEANFDRSTRFQRSANEITGIVSEEGVYLPYASKWFPIYRYLVDRSTMKLTATVPLGYTAVGPGMQSPSQVKGITEVFTSETDQPILPGSLVANRYFPTSYPDDELHVDFFVEEAELQFTEKIHSVLMTYVRYFRQKIGSYPWGNTLSVVQVANLQDYYPGAPGVLYLTQSTFKSLKPDEATIARKMAYQWWGHTLPISTVNEVWLQDALSFYAQVLYLETEKGIDAVRAEIGNLQIMALRGEGKSAILNALRLGYMGEDYLAIAGGKGSWILHMLRNQVGDDKFAMLLSQIHSNAGQVEPVTSSFRELANQVAGENIYWFFSQWVDSIGVPQFEQAAPWQPN